MGIKLSKFSPTKGKNAGKSFDMIEFMNGSKVPTRLSLKKCKLVLENREAIEMVIAQSGQ